MKEYAIYKGDDFLFTGTLSECSKFLGVKQETIYFYTMPVYKRRCRNSKNRIEIIVLED